MGVTFSLIFSSATLPNGLVSPGEVPVESYGFKAGDTNSFGAGLSVTATLVGSVSATPVVTFPASGAPDATVTCAPFSLTTIGGNTATADTSLLCNRANTDIAPGTVSVRFIRQSTEIGFDGLETITTSDIGGTSVFVIATGGSSDVITATTTTQQTVAEFTSTFVTPSSTEFYTPTTTLTGASSTKYAECSISSYVHSSSAASTSSSAAQSDSAPSYSHSYGSDRASSSGSTALSNSYTRSYGVYEPSYVPSKDGYGNYGPSSTLSLVSSKDGYGNHGPSTLSHVSSETPRPSGHYGPLPGGDDSDSDHDYNHGPAPTPTSSRAHGYGGSCRRHKHRESSSAAPTTTEHAYYRRDEGYGPPPLTFNGVTKTTSTITSTLPVSTQLGQTSVTTLTSGVTTVTVNSTVTSDLRTVTTVDGCSSRSGRAFASVSGLW